MDGKIVESSGGANTVKSRICVVKSREYESGARELPRTDETPEEVEPLCLNAGEGMLRPATPGVRVADGKREEEGGVLLISCLAPIVPGSSFVMLPGEEVRGPSTSVDRSAREIPGISKKLTQYRLNALRLERSNYLLYIRHPWTFVRFTAPARQHYLPQLVAKSSRNDNVVCWSLRQPICDKILNNVWIPGTVAVWSLSCHNF